MGESVLQVVLAALVVGQWLSARNGRRAAVTYYLCVAPLDYFTVWIGASWNAGRLCGAVLLAAAVIYRWDRAPPRAPSLPIALRSLAAYGVALTIIGMTWWPISSMAGRSAIYGSLRGLIQIVNWLIVLGLAVQIGRVLSEPGGLASVRRWLLLVGVLHSLYAGYQVVAYEIGLPATGIRRALVAEGGPTDEEQAAYVVDGRVLKRPGSLIGEPKGLGGACVSWLALTATVFLGGGGTWTHVLGLGLFTATLWLTASTSAWAGALVVLLLGLWVSLRDRRARGGLALLPMLLFAGAAIAWNSESIRLFLGLDLWRDIVQERWSARLADPLADLAEREALAALAERPLLALVGTGLGGMSFLIAEQLGGGQELILFPNNGLLGWISNVGLVGLALLLAGVIPGVRTLATGDGGRDARLLGFLGTVLLLQVMVFSQPWLVSLGVGALLGARDLARRTPTPEPGSLRWRT